MITNVHIDPVISKLVILSLVIILAGFILLLLKQPSIITYIVVRVLLGPNGFKLITDEQLVTNLEALGLVLLLFFIGMEISFSKLIANWRISVLGTFFPVIISITAVWISGYYVAGIINDYSHQLIISIIAFSLLLSSFWIAFVHRLFRYKFSKTKNQ